MLRHEAKHPESEAGFTLIELMVTVLIIGILIAIALPTMVGAKTRAEQRSAQVDLRDALTASKVFYTDGSTYTGLDDVQLIAIEPQIKVDMAVAPNAVKDMVSVRVAAANEVMLVTRSGDGLYFCLAESSGAMIRGADPATDGFATVADCAAAPQTW